MCSIVVLALIRYAISWRDKPLDNDILGVVGILRPFFPSVCPKILVFLLVFASRIAFQVPSVALFGGYNDRLIVVSNEDPMCVCRK